MGWSRGSEIFSRIIVELNNTDLTEDQRYIVYKGLIEVFTDNDWDTEEECLGDDPAYDKAYYELYPELKEEEYEDDE